MLITNNLKKAKRREAAQAVFQFLTK